MTDPVVEKIMDFGFSLENQCYDRDDLRPDAQELAAEICRLLGVEDDDED